MEIITEEQKQVLSLVANSPFSRSFYLSGGTALSYYYLQHRKSEDLDFFSETEFDTQAVTIFIKSLQSTLQFTSFEYQNSFNRNLYFLKFPSGYVLKLEFTYYPFARIEPQNIQGGIQVDSLLDITVNKLFTITQTPRGRDYYDLYVILKRYSYKIKKLRMLAKQKFDWDIDPLFLATQFDQAYRFLDDPILFEEIPHENVVLFFEQLALEFKAEILTE